MSEEKKELKKNEELCEGKQKLSIEELENVNGGVFALCIGKTVVGGDEGIVE